jgi:propionyl-CoA carboxylase alpha chain
MDIPIYYDPMIAKLITWGKDREEAIERMKRAIDEYIITGCATTLSFCRFVMDHPAFRSGKFDTNFVQHYFTPDKLNTHSADEKAELAATLVALNLQQSARKVGSPATASAGTETSRWKLIRKNQ